MEKPIQKRFPFDRKKRIEELIKYYEDSRNDGLTDRVVTNCSVFYSGDSIGKDKIRTIRKLVRSAYGAPRDYETFMRVAARNFGDEGFRASKQANKDSYIAKSEENKLRLFHGAFAVPSLGMGMDNGFQEKHIIAAVSYLSDFDETSYVDDPVLDRLKDSLSKEISQYERDKQELGSSVDALYKLGTDLDNSKYKRDEEKNSEKVSELFRISGDVLAYKTRTMTEETYNSYLQKISGENKPETPERKKGFLERILSLSN